MKKWFVFSSVLLFIVLIFFPSSFLSASPGLLTNGDFETGDFTGWNHYDATVFYDNTYGGTFSYVASLKIVPSIPGPDYAAVISQRIENIYSPELTLSFSYWNVFSSGESTVEINFIDSKTNISTASLTTEILPYNSSWQTKSYDILQWWDSENPGTSFPYFDEILIIARQLGKEFGDLWVDNIYLGKAQVSGPSDSMEHEKTAWVRNHDMTCYQVWVNEKNNFEFVFWWEYADNNHVQIYDMAGNLVFEIDMQKGNPSFEAPLPDGMYTVKTFHEAGNILQEFVIGKP